MNTSFVLASAGALLCASLALSFAWFERRSVACWSLIAGLVVLAIERIFAGLTAIAVLPQEMIYWQDWRLVTISFLPGAWLLFSLKYARESDSASPAKGWLPLAVASLIPIGLAFWFRGSLVPGFHRNGLGQPWSMEISGAGLILCGIVLISFVAVMANLEHTFRASAGVIRWRIKFMVLGLGLLFIVRVYSGSQELLFRATTLPLQDMDSDVLLVTLALMGRSLFRDGRLEGKVYASRLVLHQSLTAIGAAVYVLVIVGLAKAAAILHSDKQVALQILFVLVALALLGSLLLSDRVRLYTRRFVTRYFQRPQYDYRSVWRNFTQGTIRQVEPRALSGALVKLVSELFQALSVSLWLADDRRESFSLVASTSVSDPEALDFPLGEGEAARVLSILKAGSEPMDIDRSRELWAATLRKLLPGRFPNGGNRICVPLRARDELLGIMILGDRVGGVPYSAQDFDLLKTVGDQAAATLLNLELSQRLYQANQLEAFQAMSAFFVHDLKNTASTLSLMLQNLPVHFDNASFREDALRGVAKTVDHINELIDRLSLLRQEVVLLPVESDLNELVEAALLSVPELPGAELIQDLHPLPSVRVDRAQIRNVVSNLIMNAHDAIELNGRIRVATVQRNNWVVLTVEDNGCGMSPEFVERGLFRPFQSTKKNGIGIGMFQCKMIVQAHHGKIEVDSQPGKGTAFRVWLPIRQTSHRLPAELAA